MRQDLMYVHPDDFVKAFDFFKYCFEIWTVGYAKYAKEDYSANFIKDSTVPRGVIMFCLYGDRDMAVPVFVPDKLPDFTK